MGSMADDILFNSNDEMAGMLVKRLFLEFLNESVIIMASTAVHTIQRPTEVVQDLRQQARDFHIPDFSPPWSFQIHPGKEETKKAAEEWALYHFHPLVGSKRFSKIMESDIDVFSAGFYNTGPLWGVEFGMEYLLLLFVLDDEVLHRTTSSGDHEEAHVTGIAQIFLELVLVMMSSFPLDKALEEALETILAVDEKWEVTKRVRIEKFLAQAVQNPGTVDFSDEVADVSGITSAFRNLWRRATSVMSEDWSLRFAYLSQRDMLAMFKETLEGNVGVALYSISEYIQQRRAYGFSESALVIGELAEGIHVSSAIYSSPPMQGLVQAAIDVVSWHNDIRSFQKELLAGEVNLVHLISKREGCSYNRAAEIVNKMVMNRCEDLSLAAAELRQHADSEEGSSALDSENTEKYILLCTNLVSASHEFHQRSARFHKY